jgi:hypothetical protein
MHASENVFSVLLALALASMVGASAVGDAGEVGVGEDAGEGTYCIKLIKKSSSKSTNI